MLPSRSFKAIALTILVITTLSSCAVLDNLLNRATEVVVGVHGEGQDAHIAQVIRENPAIRDASKRIEEAIDRVQLWAEGTNWDLGDFSEGILDDQGEVRQYSEITVLVDFASILTGVHYDDFFVARETAKLHMDRLYGDLARMFDHTNNLTIRERNLDALNDFQVPPEVEDMSNFELEIGRFISSPEKFLAIETHFGVLTVFSDFFYGRTGHTAIEHLRLVFGYQEEEEGYHPTITFSVQNIRGNLVNVENPGRSARLAIPLTADFMRDAEGRLLYNAVEYIDINGAERGILPRSFIAGNYLYIYANRTGSFRLTYLEGDNPFNRDLFLSNRGIHIDGVPGNPGLVSRGQLYQSIMRIHWVEDLFWDISRVESFPDVPRGTELDRSIKIGTLMDVFRVAGYEDGNFRPNIAAERSHLFDLLAGYIITFGADVDGLLPAIPQAAGMAEVIAGVDAVSQGEVPMTRENWWFAPFGYLMNIGFVPYRMVSGVPHIAPHEPVTVGEMNELLFRLITTRHFP